MSDEAEAPITNGNYSGEDSQSEDSDIEQVDKPENVKYERQPKSIMKKAGSVVPAVAAVRPELPEQPALDTLDISKLTPLSEPIIARQATINIGTIGTSISSLELFSRDSLADMALQDMSRTGSPRS